MITKITKSGTTTRLTKSEMGTFRFVETLMNIMAMDNPDVEEYSMAAEQLHRVNGLWSYKISDLNTHDLSKTRYAQTMLTALCRHQPETKEYVEAEECISSVLAMWDHKLSEAKKEKVNDGDS